MPPEDHTLAASPRPHHRRQQVGVPTVPAEYRYVVARVRRSPPHFGHPHQRTESAMHRGDGGDTLDVRVCVRQLARDWLSTMHYGTRTGGGSEGAKERPGIGGQRRLKDQDVRVELSMVAAKHSAPCPHTAG